MNSEIWTVRGRDLSLGVTLEQYEYQRIISKLIPIWEEKVEFGGFGCKNQ